MKRWQVIVAIGLHVLAMAVVLCIPIYNDNHGVPLTTLRVSVCYFVFATITSLFNVWRIVVLARTLKS